MHLVKTTNPSSFLSARDLTLFRGRTCVIKNLNFSLAPGMQVAIVGPNGGGKSTLLEALSKPRLDKQTRGHLERQLVPPRGVAYLPQKSEAQRTFPLLVRDVVAGGIWNDLGYLRPMTAGHQALINEALLSVGLKGFALQSIGALSGGQFQRVLFARLIVQNAPLLLLDEPLTGVDTPTQEDLLGLIQTWGQEGRTQIVVLHDMDVVRRFFSHTLLLARDFSCFGETAQILTRENLTHAYQQAQSWEGA